LQNTVGIGASELALGFHLMLRLCLTGPTAAQYARALMKNNSL
jgi:hypothetical protein